MKRSALAVVGLVACTAAWTPSPLAATEGEANEALLRELLLKLEERDAVISELRRRLDALERRVESTPPATERTAAAAPAPEPGPAATSASPSAPAQAPAAPPPRQASAPAATAPGPQAASAATASAPATPGSSLGGTAPEAEQQRASGPGAFEVDEEAAERALERTLTAAGALLLRPGRAEIEPSFVYTRQEDKLGTFVDVPGPGAGILEARDLKQRRNDFRFGLDLRVGLPWDSQFEFGVPYRYQGRETVVAGFDSTSRSAHGFGDIRVGFAKTVLREDRWWPDLVARVRWDADTGQTRNNQPLGQGFHQFGGSLTAIKRQDPLAFVGNAFYRKSFSSGEFEPGDEYGFSIGTVLAASPETSLQASLLQSFSRSQAFNGQKIPGTDQVSSVLTVGASSILGKGVLLSFTAGVGLTDAAPDYFVGFSIPIAFNVPKP
ncbi:MAG: hypothetical protein EA405_03845 [Rhodospirillales bacterium]|nr:MAG: hypothetical protein EA405_03845 [Rhodospirillales bacterium]